jgi:ribosome-associated heat shock protein Hsp15
MEGPQDEKHRLDKWLWAARFFKTRAIAAEAISAGKVELNGERPKRGKAVKIGDRVEVRLGPYRHHVVVRELSGRRGPAAEAARLYEETADSRAERERLSERLRSTPPAFFYDKGRPTKKDRRELNRFRDRNEG